MLIKGEATDGGTGRLALRGARSEIKLWIYLVRSLADGRHFVTISCGRLFSPVKLINVV